MATCSLSLVMTAVTSGGDGGTVVVTSGVHSSRLGWQPQPCGVPWWWGVTGVQRPHKTPSPPQPLTECWRVSHLPLGKPEPPEIKP